MKRFATASVVLCAALFASGPVFADGGRPLAVGGRVGANFVERSQPNDPPGEPTVLFGTAFTGWELKGGAALQMELSRLGNAPLLLDVDLLFSYARATGYAESRTSDARRELTLVTTGIHLPVLLGYGIESESTMLEFALGPEALVGLASGSVASQTGVEGALPPIQTRPVIHVGLTGKLGIAFEVGDSLVPIELRATYDPFVAKTTRDRFSDFQSFENPGEYGVAFNWHIGASVGWLVQLDGDEDDTPTATPTTVEPEEDSDDN